MWTSVCYSIGREDLWEKTTKLREIRRKTSTLGRPRCRRRGSATSWMGRRDSRRDTTGLCRTGSVAIPTRHCSSKVVSLLSILSRIFATTPDASRPIACKKVNIVLSKNSRKYRLARRNWIFGWIQYFLFTFAFPYLQLQAQRQNNFPKIVQLVSSSDWKSSCPHLGNNYSGIWRIQLIEGKKIGSWMDEHKSLFVDQPSLNTIAENLVLCSFRHPFESK